MNVWIVIPAYNEEQRIESTLRLYSEYFTHKEHEGVLTYHIVVVLNGCKDNTLSIARHAAEAWGHIHVLDFKRAGKGFAVREGFSYALRHNADLIGFVDADMSTEAPYFYDLIKNIGSHDGIIASRYLPESHVSPARPLVKSWGRKIVYNGLNKLLFGLRYADTQCGAKLFTRRSIEVILPHLRVDHWAFDVELLYLARKFGFRVIEIPTVWYDKAGSKLLTFRAGMYMIWSLIKLRFQHTPFFYRRVE